MAVPMEEAVERSAKSGDENPHVLKMEETAEERSAESEDDSPPRPQRSTDEPHPLSSATEESEVVSPDRSTGEVDLSPNPSPQRRYEAVFLKGKRPTRRRTRLGTIREEPESEDHKKCRSCFDDDTDEEAENTGTGNRLIRLGCKCTGPMSRMHRKCVLQWFGPRIIWENDYHCEICKGIVNPRIAYLLKNAMEGPDSERDILHAALTQPRPTELLVQALRQTRPLQTSSDTETPRNERRIVIQPAPPEHEVDPLLLLRRSSLGCASIWELFIFLVIFLVVVGVVLSLLFHGIPPATSYNS